jgi:3'-phosphoadenosine 5'-phosphosulfate (PAPS) 3'-phosphatase
MVNRASARSPFRASRSPSAPASRWDNCAPAAVAIAAGLHASRADGTPLRYNNADIYLPDLLICRKEHASQVFEALRIAEPVMG